MKNIMSLCASLLLLAMSYPAGAAILNATCGTVNGVIASAKAGDEIVLANGICNNLSIDFNPSESGTQSNPITLRPQSPGGVTFIGVSPLTLKKDWLVVDGFKWDSNIFSDDIVLIKFDNTSHSVFRNNVLYNSGRTTELTGIMRILNGSQYNLITRNRFDSLKNMGIQVWAWDGSYGNTNNIISWNYFYNMDNGSGHNVLQIGQGWNHGADSNYLNNTDYYTIIEYNVFEDIGSGTSELISNKTSFNTYRYNTFRNCASRLILRFGINAEVRGNWFLNSPGIRAYDEDHKIYNNYLEGGDITLSSGNLKRPDVVLQGDIHYVANNALIANNTIVNPSTEGIYLGRNSSVEFPTGVFWTYDPTNTIIKNNIVMNNSGIAYRDQASINTTWMNNIAYPTGSGSQGYSGPGLTRVNPQLVAGEPYRLQAGSPAIDAGSVVALVTDDMDGQPRDAKPDIGSDEFSSVSIARRPLTSADVGPVPLSGAIPTTPQGIAIGVEKN